MTVKDLIHTLQDFADDTDVYIYDYDDEKRRLVTRVFVDVDDFSETQTQIEDVYLL